MHKIPSLLHVPTSFLCLLWGNIERLEDIKRRRKPTGNKISMHKWRGAQEMNKARREVQTSEYGAGGGLKVLGLATMSPSWLSVKVCLLSWLPVDWKAPPARPGGESLYLGLNEPLCEDQTAPRVQGSRLRNPSQTLSVCKALNQCWESHTSIILTAYLQWWKSSCVAVVWVTFKTKFPTQRPGDRQQGWYRS